MSTSQLVLNVGLLLVVLGTNLGTRAVTGRRLLLPVVLVLVAGWFFLQDLPTTAGDARLELAGALTGVALGVAAAALMPVRRDGTGRIVTTAGDRVRGPVDRGHRRSDRLRLLRHRMGVPVRR